MKNLTGLLLIFFVTMYYHHTNAQTFAIKGGLNLANMLDKDDDDKYSDDWPVHLGLNFGCTMDVPINEFLSFEPGLLLTTKGTETVDRGRGFEIKARVNLYYLDIPLTIKTAFEVEKGIKMYGAFGPYLGVGLSGQANARLFYQGKYETIEEVVKWGSDEDEDHFRRSELGVTFGAGMELKSILLGVSCDIGLSNIAAKKDNGLTAKNRVFKCSVGYRL